MLDAVREKRDSASTYGQEACLCYDGLRIKPIAVLHALRCCTLHLVRRNGTGMSTPRTSFGGATRAIPDEDGRQRAKITMK